MGVRRRSAGVPHDIGGMGTADRVADRYAEAGVETVTRDERRAGARVAVWWRPNAASGRDRAGGERGAGPARDLRAHQGRSSGRNVRGGPVRLVTRTFAAAALAAACATPRAAP